MHVGSLMLFELPEGYQGDYYEDVKAMLGKRLHLASVLLASWRRCPLNLPNRCGLRTTTSTSTTTCAASRLRRPGTMRAA